jgi:hypothetical protein
MKRTHYGRERVLGDGGQPLEEQMQEPAPAAKPAQRAERSAVPASYGWFSWWTGAAK